MRPLFSFLLLLSLSLSAPAAAHAMPLADDGEGASLARAVSRSQAYLRASKRATIPLGDRQVPIAHARATADRFAELLAAHGLTAPFFEAVAAEFDWIAMPGHDGMGTVHVTGYHLPLLEAREGPDARFRYPLYAVPGALQRRYDRVAIDVEGALDGLGYELAWVDDELGRYSLMVQGSGLLRFEDGRIVNVNYAGANGFPYTSLGKALVADGRIPQATISMPAIESYFREHPGELAGYLNRNPSYVFFRLAAEGPFGADGIGLTAGRAIATDKRLFGSGLLAYLTYPRAQFAPDGGVAAWETGSRFVMDQDTGGAIKGPGRVDVYWGGGAEAALRAGTLNGEARVWYLLLKEKPRP